MNKINGDWLGYYVENGEFDEEIYGGYAPYFRKRFALKAGEYKAELKIAALGWVKVYLNGKEVTKDEEFLVSWTDYNKRIEYVSYDVTDFLAEDNAIGAVLGYGWACGSIVWNNARKYYGVKHPCFVAELVITYANGEVERVRSDGSWKANVGAIRANDIMAGEYVDARESLGDFSAADYDDSAWRAPQIRESRSALLTEELGERTRVQERVPLRYMHTVGGGDIYTTDQNLTGFLTCKIVGKRGTKITFRHGEMLSPDKTLYTDNLRSAKATDTYICAGGGEELFRPLFTFHGFQFVEVKIEGEAKISELCALVVHSDLEWTGAFECSNALVNKIYQNARWGQKSNFLNVPTDCPQRDERLGWTGDAHVFCGTAMFNADCRKFFQKYLVDLVDTQDERGSVACIAPCPEGFLANAASSSAWSDAIVILSYYYWRFYGDTELVERYMPAMKKYVRFAESIATDYKRDSYCFGDWLAFEETGGEAFDLMAFACLYRMMRRMCEATEDHDALIYAKKHAEVKKRFWEKFVDEKTGRISVDTQSMYLFACQFRLMSREEVRPHLVRKLAENDYKLSSGFIGIKFLLPILCEIGESELAYRILCDDRCPSWGYSIKNGATTMWERWDSYTAENGFHPDGMNSFNHYSFGSCVEWYYKYILGINPGESGFEKLKFCPYIDGSGRVTSAEGSYRSVKGTISVKWAVSGKEAVCELTLPEGLRYEAEFPTFSLTGVKRTGNTVTFSLKRF